MTTDPMVIPPEVAPCTWLYIRSEPGLWTVGFYKPNGKWEPESDHGNRNDAAKRVHWLNGGAEGAWG